MNDPAWGVAEAVDFVGVSPHRSLTQVVLGFMYTMDYIYQNLKRLVDVFLMGTLVCWGNTTSPLRVLVKVLLILFSVFQVLITLSNSEPWISAP